MALYGGERPLDLMQWHQATSTEVWFGGRKGDQAQQRSAVVCTRDDARGHVPG